ncbi:MAG: hypothetical protein CL575_01630 [Altererythrobacter sp.]|nr:hypothetical protein [Altererythrobacter sp.]|tara:strand:- start:11052 stop:12971 length:1920 start_codon:yes stop_codon:yes gene_type:complete
MGKVVKGVAKIFIPVLGGAKGIAGAALTALGAITGNFQLIAAGISLTASTLTNKKAPQNSPANADRLRASIDPRAPRKTVVGNTALATDIRDEEFTDDQEYFHRFIVCASHKVESIDEIWFDDKRAWSASGGVQGDAVGYLQVQTRTEGSAANAINISSRMGSTRRYTGMAYVHLRHKLTGNSKKAESPYAQGITQRITIRGKAATLPDPRDPAQDMADQSTWVWDNDACRNPALALLFYLLGYRINGKLAVGKGIPADRIDLESFAVAANICDEPVATQTGGTEPRYRCDGIWSEGDSPTTVIDMLKATMNADLDDVGGKLRLTVFHNDLSDVVADFDDDDILGDFTWQATTPLDQTYNIVRGGYTNPGNDALYQQMDYPAQEVPSPDGIDRIFNFDLPLVQSPDQAQRLAAIRLKRAQFSGTFSADYQATGWKVQKNSIIRQTFKQTGFVNKVFRVAEMEIRQDGVVPLVLTEEDASIYGNPSLAPAIAVVSSTPYNYSLNPVYQAIIASEQNLIATSSQPGLSLTASDSSIVISDHTRQYTDISRAVIGTTLTEDDQGNPIAETTRYYLYYDDAARQGGAVSWNATTSFNKSQTKEETPARHFGGYITTAASGGTTDGGGALPPGSGGTDPGTYPP